MKKKQSTSAKILEIPLRDKFSEGGAPMLYAGIDAHKRTCTVIIIDDQGKTVKEGTIRTEEAAIKEFFAPYKEKVSAVVETCLNWNFIYRVLNGYIQKISVAHAYKLRIIAEAKVKTDKISAFTLAQMLRIGYIPEIFIPDEKTMKLRELMRARVYLTRIKTRMKNKIHSLLDKNGLCGHTGTDLFGVAGRKFLKGIAIGNPEKGIISRYLGIIEKLEEDIKALEIVLANNSDDHPDIRLLRSIPGIGKISSQLLLAEMGPITRFKTKERLCSFVGLCPRVYCSGGTERRGHISKEGNKYIRWIMTECAHISIRHSPGLRRIYNKIQRKHGGKVAVIAVARRMLEIVFNVLTKQQEFDEIKAFPKKVPDTLQFLSIS